MAKLTTAEFIEAIKELSVLELNELVKACEEEFGVSAAAGVVVAAAGPAEAAEEKTEFDVELTEGSGVPVIKAVRELTGLGLKEAKEIVDNVPAIVLRGISEDEANKIKDMFESLGAKVTVISKTEMDGEQIICTNCGSRIKKQAKFCKYCGHENEDGGDEL